MKKTVAMFVMIFILLSLTGCASYSVYQASKQQVYAKKVVETKRAAVKAFADGETGTVGIGIDVLALEVLKENPGKQLGAAILDAAILYGAYEGIQYIQDQSSKIINYNVSITGNYNNVIIVDDSDNVTITTEHNHDIVIDK